MPTRLTAEQANQPDQTEQRSIHPRDTEERPQGVATLKDISDKVDDARQVAYDTRADFNVFQTALVGVPGVSRGALGEIRDSLASNAVELKEANRQRAEIDERAAQRGKDFLEALPDLINKTVEDTDNVRLRGKFSALRSHIFTLTILILASVVSTAAILVFHIGR
jgi:hypothetical protein